MSDRAEVARGVNILVIDSGGASSLSSLLILDEAMTRLQHALGLDECPNVFEYFDVVAGTGTGAIIVCLIGRLRVSVRQAIVYYQRLADVFSNKRPIRGEIGAFRMSKLEVVMKAIVKEVTGNENTRMMDTRLDSGWCKTMVFAMSRHNMNAALPCIFRSYQGTTNQIDDCAIWEAVCASMAHPELFKSFDVGQGSLRQSYVGGALGCSNPIEHVLIEAKALFPNRHLSSIFSVGAGHTCTIQISQPSLLQSILSTNALIAMKDVAIDSEAAAQRMATRFEHVRDVYFRLNVAQGLQDVRMCDWERLNEVQAHTVAYMRLPETSGMLDGVVRAVKQKRNMIGMSVIDGQVQKPAVQPIGITLCPAPTPVFTGREDKIAQVEKCLSSGDTRRCVFVLHGMGGAGKTQIALKTVERTHDMWSDIVYVDATTRETAVRALAAFAEAKGIGKTHREALAYLSSRRERWLMLIDNADDPSLGISDFLPRGDHGSILITSRLADVALLGRGRDSGCQMSSMEPGEAMELLLKTARMGDAELPNEEQDAAIALLQNLGYLALAVVHAGAYIHRSSRTIHQYHEMFLRRRQTTLERYSELQVKVDGYQWSVYTTWRMSYERLSSHAKEILGLMAYMHHTNITEDIFRRAALCAVPSGWFVPFNELEVQAQSDVKDCLQLYFDSNAAWDSDAFLSIMTELTSYSLVAYDRVNDMYTIHVLVHDWAKTVIPHSSEHAVLRTMLLLADSIIWDETDVNNSAYARAVEVHVSHVLALDVRPNDYIASQLSFVYRCTGRWDQQEALELMMLATCREALGDNHTRTLAVMQNLANTYGQQGRYKDEEALQYQAVEGYKRVLGKDDPETLRAIQGLAIAYMRQGQYDKAEDLLLRVADARKQKLGREHYDTLMSMGDLANTYSYQCRYSEAEALLLQVVAAFKRTLGNEHPNTLVSMHNLAATYSGQGRHNEAETLQLEVLAIRKRTLGDDHPHTLSTEANLANTYGRQGHYEKAEALQLRVLGARKRVLGPRHPDTLWTMNDLARTYESLGLPRQNELEVLRTEIEELKGRPQ